MAFYVQDKADGQYIRIGGWTESRDKASKFETFADAKQIADFWPNSKVVSDESELASVTSV